MLGLAQVTFLGPVPHFGPSTFEGLSLADVDMNPGTTREAVQSYFEHQ